MHSGVHTERWQQSRRKYKLSTWGFGVQMGLVGGLSVGQVQGHGQISYWSPEVDSRKHIPSVYSDILVCLLPFFLPHLSQGGPSLEIHVLLERNSTIISKTKKVKGTERHWNAWQMDVWMWVLLLWTQRYFLELIWGMV